MDEIFKNDNKIRIKYSLTGFWGRWLRIYCQIYKIQYGGSKIDGIFKNDNKINIKYPFTGFWGRWLRIYCHIYKIQYGGFKMVDDILENTVVRLNFS